MPNMNGVDFLRFLEQLKRDLAEVGLAPPKTVAELKQGLASLQTDSPSDAQAFDLLPAEERDSLAGRLARIQQGLQGYADGSTDPSSIMAKKLTSNRAVWILGFLVAVSTLSLIITICRWWDDATRAAAPCDLQRSSVPASQSASAAPGATATPQPGAAAAPANASAAAGAQGTGTSGGGSSTGTRTTDAGQAPGTQGTGTGSGSGSQQNNSAKTSDKTPEVMPSQATLTTCQTIPLRVPGFAESDISWSEVLTGSLSNDGVYAAPSSIAGQQVLKIGATVKVGGQTQTAKAATIVLVPPGGPQEKNVLIMIALMGALGGCLHWISGFAFFVGNREFLRSWTAFYLLMPIEGAALAIIVYLLLRVGILTPGSTSGQATAALNTIGLYAFAGLTGIYSKQALQSLGDIFNVIFKKVQAKDEGKTEAKANKTKP